MNNLINNAASDMSVHWNKTNRAFTDRLASSLKTASDKILQDQRMPGRAQKPQVQPDPDKECK